jgi:RNA polymerase sigma factor (sigma-70 family)
MSSTHTPTSSRANACFVTTRWSVVLAARDQSMPGSEAALEALCRSYWYPLYVYVRRLGRGPHDAQDLTQEFFARLLHKDYLHAVAPEKGKFRTFLLVALKRFLADDWDRSRAQKRGGGCAILPLDTSLAESRYALESADGLSPEKNYERRWALTLLEQVMARLRQEAVAADKLEQFECLKEYLAAGKSVSTGAALAARLGLSEGAARVAVHRLRRRFRRVFQEEIAHTVASPQEAEEEVRYLITLFGE